MIRNTPLIGCPEINTHGMKKYQFKANSRKKSSKLFLTQLA